MNPGLEGEMHSRTLLRQKDKTGIGSQINKRIVSMLNFLNNHTLVIATD